MNNVDGAEKSSEMSIVQQPAPIPPNIGVTDRDQLLEKIPADGTFIGNKTIREQLGWAPDRYFRVRNGLIDEGLVIRGKGKGGSTARAIERAEEKAPSTEPLHNASRCAEKDLYDPIRQTLCDAWSADRGHEYSAVEITAAQGSKSTGGKWSRPDIVAIQIGIYKYVPNKILDVLTFEVKPADSLDVTCVYEALAHRRAANYSYVLLHVPDPEQHDLDVITNEAKVHGIGVVTFNDPTDYETWDEVVVPARLDSDPSVIDEFIRTQLSEDSKHVIERSVR